MSERVINNIARKYATFSGNLEEITPSYVHVPSMEDIDIMDQKIEAIYKQFDDLRELTSYVIKENKKLHDQIYDLLIDFKDRSDKADVELLAKLRSVIHEL